MLVQLRQSVIMLVFLSILTGIIYPAMTTLIGQAMFPQQANGSLLTKHNQIIGSQLIGQNFTSVNYFWGRISATSPYPYNAAASSGSNFGLTNPAFLTEVNGRVAALQDFDKENRQLIPIDLVTSSASGLDPDISLAAALYQAPRIAKVRDISIDKIKQLIYSNVQKPLFTFIGEERVNVLMLNLALDKLTV